jgi:hypothetical protein
MGTSPGDRVTDDLAHEALADDWRGPTTIHRAGKSASR